MIQSTGSFSLNCISGMTRGLHVTNTTIDKSVCEIELWKESYENSNKMRENLKTTAVDWEEEQL